MQRLIWAAALSICVSGCASLGNFNTAFRTNTLEPNESAFIDAKQRAIITNVRLNASGQPQQVICAEPGPDVFTANSGSLSGSGSNSGTSIGLAAATGESAGALSAPTTALLSQRHAYYRICEEYMNGVGDDIDYMLGLRSNQRDLPTLLAIEQLTGAVRAAPVVLSSAGSSTTGQILAQLTASRAQAEERRRQYDAQIESIDARITAIERRGAEITTRLGQDGVPDAEKAALDAEKSRLEAEKARLDQQRGEARAGVERAEADIRTLDQAIAAAREGSATVSSTGVVISTGSPSTISDDTAEHISNAVVRLVEMANGRDFGPTTCLAILRRQNPPRDAVTQCADILSSYNNSINQRTTSRQVLATSAANLIQESIRRRTPLTEAEARVVVELLEAAEGEAPPPLAAMR